jgi:hypothetical protein
MVAGDTRLMHSLSREHETRNQIRQIFEAIRHLIAPPQPSRRPIRFIRPDEQKKYQNYRFSITIIGKFKGILQIL